MLTRGAVFGTLFVTVPTGIASFVKSELLVQFLAAIPFVGLGLSWMLPAFITGILFLVVSTAFKQKV